MKILLIDGYNLFIRCFTKITIVNNEGNQIGGVVGSITSLYSYCNLFKPDAIYIFFDGKNSGNRRRKSFKDYKSGRKAPHTIGVDSKSFPVESDFWNSLNLFVELLSELPVNIVSTDYLEADDMIAYACKFLSGKKFIISTDKDYYQLIDDNVFIFHPGQKQDSSKIYDKVYFQEIYEIPPENWIIIKSIIGDNSDNIKKIPIERLGLKTILKLFPELKTIIFNDIEEFIELIKNKEDIKILKFKNDNIYNILKNNYILMDLKNIINNISAHNVTILRNQLLETNSLNFTNFQIAILSNDITLKLSEDNFSYIFTKLLHDSAKYKKHVRKIWE